ncbi:MAG: WecB/TagA/CpsF family glycosyltransferase [Ruminococcaceae bacterium]|jgi:N-acetylglucosaminyldiphosphoundecaprenol N-acetyl-beta-D-mannosaminyltransferase|nr:WecB/TagA/CpsF family glycosyltransferase [Oscillospiraceae bacterium]
MRNEILSVGFDNVTLDEAVETAMGYIERGEKCRVVTPNAEIGLDCLKNEQLRKLVNESELVLPDGVGVVHAARILDRPLKGKVPGIEFGEKLCDRLQNTGKTLFLFGSKPGVADAAAVKLKEKYPGLLIAGTLNGYFSDEKTVVDTINAAEPDVLFVCLGCPKQELFMERWRDELTCSVMAGLGGSLDVLSGNLQRAPKAFRDLGLEWFYRLLKEPKRIKRMARLPLYLIYAEREKRKGKKHA